MLVIKTNPVPTSCGCLNARTRLSSLLVANDEGRAVSRVFRFGFKSGNPNVDGRLLLGTPADTGRLPPGRCPFVCLVKEVEAVTGFEPA